jgi:lysozyme family protein
MIIDLAMAFSILAGIEGKGTTNDPDDPGGLSTIGMTETTARDLGYTGRMEDLTPERCMELADIGFWRPSGADRLPSPLNLAVFIAAYHTGPEQTVKILQRLGHADDDGIFGPATLRASRGITVAKFQRAIRDFYVEATEARVARRLRELGDDAARIAEARRFGFKYLKGWLNRLEKVQAALKEIPC